VGAVCFGVVVGYITYRTLKRRTGPAQLSDIATVIGAIGGAAITSMFDNRDTDAFGWYSIGLLIGFVAWLLISLALGDKADSVMGD
jgi:uncharacterized membrane protein YeaQ/YmgE (transglycosylase-associated protein family)